MGAIAPGYQADLVIFNNMKDFKIIDVYHKGKLIDKKAPIKVGRCPAHLKRTVNLDKVSAEDFKLPIRNKQTHIIGMEPKQIVTQDIKKAIAKTDNYVPKDGYLKIAAVERHQNSGKIGVAITKGYGIKGGAVASSVSHDSHNIIVLGDNDADMFAAVEELDRINGGYTIVSDQKTVASLPLALGGLMSTKTADEFIPELDSIIQKAYDMGVDRDIDPFITLSFTALPVIPEIRITDSGLFDVMTFQFINKNEP
jgi:adenine deaminase